MSSGVQFGNRGLVKMRIAFFNKQVAKNDGPEPSFDRNPPDVRNSHGKSDVVVPKLDARRDLPVAEGAVNTYLDEKGEVKMGKDKLYGVSQTYEGRLEFVADAVEGCVEKFIDGGLSKQIKAFEARIDELRKNNSNGDLLKECEENLKALKRGFGTLKEARKRVAQGVMDKLKALKDLIANTDLPAKDRLKYERAALDELRRAIRLFRFEMDNRLGDAGRIAGGGSWGHRRVNNFFHKIGDCVHNLVWCGKADFQRKDKDRPDFTGLADANASADVENARTAYSLLRTKLLNGREDAASVPERMPDFSPECMRASEISMDFHTVNNYIRGAILSGDDSGYSFGLIRDQLADMAKNGGHKTSEFYFGVGVGFKPCEEVNLRAMADFRYQHRVICNGTGTVTVERLGGVSATGRADFGRKGSPLYASAHLEGGYMGGSESITFQNVDDAARYLTSGDPKFIYGGMGKLGWVAFSGSLPGRSNDSKTFLKYLHDHDILSKMSQNIQPGANKVLVSAGSFNEVNFGAGGEVAVTAGNLVDIGVGGGAEFTRRWGANEGHKPYLSTIETDFSGVATELLMDNDTASRVGEAFASEIIQSGKNDRPDLNLEDAELVESIRETVSKENGSVGEEEIIDKAKRLVKRVNEYAIAANAALGDMEAGKLPGLQGAYERVVAKYRAGAELAAALFEKWEAIRHTKPELQSDYDITSRNLRAMLINPAVGLPHEYFKSGLMISSEEAADSYWTQKYNLKVKWNVIGNLSKKLMKLPAFDDTSALNGGSVPKMIGKVASQAGVEGAMGLVNGALGLGSNRGEAEVIVRNPVERAPSPAGPVRRPWGNKRQTEVNLRVGPSTPVVALVLYVAAMIYAKSKGEKLKDEKFLKASDVIKAAGLNGFLFKPFTRAILDAWAHAWGKAGADAANKTLGDGLRKADSHFGVGSFEKTSGKNLQLVFEDGRLRSFSMGDHYKLDLRVDVGLPAGGLAIEAGTRQDSISNATSHWTTPSFNSLAAKCEGYSKSGNCTDWAVFEKENESAFTRMYDIIVKPKAELTGIDAEDRAQFEKVLAEIENDKAPVEPKDVRKRFERNRLEIESFKKRKVRDPHDRAKQVKVLLECIVRHYRLQDLALNFKKVMQEKAKAGQPLLV